MQNKFPIGQTATANEVDGVAGNDKLNKDSLAAIGHENKRPRYSIFAIAANGPNFYSPAGVWDLVSGGGSGVTLTTANAAPFDFSGYASLSFTLSIGASSNTVTFVTADFEDPENGTAEEVVTRLNTTSLGATAAVSTDDPDKVTLTSDDGSSPIIITDTTANGILGFAEGAGVTEPNRTSPGGAGSDFANGAGKSMEMEYEAREPIIFIGGQLFVGEITNGTGGVALSGSTTIHVEKVDADTSTNILSLDTHVHEHGPAGQKLGPNGDNKNVLISVPGSRSQFATGERFRFRVMPNGAAYNTSTHGLRGVSAVLWFKALHR